MLLTVYQSLKARAVLARGGLPRALETFGLEPVGASALPLVAGDWTPEMRHVARVAGVVLGVRPVKCTCLPTAVTLAEMLHRHGGAVDVVIGVGSADGFSAHAWVELAEGRIDPAGHPLSAHRELARLRHSAPVSR